MRLRLTKNMKKIRFRDTVLGAFVALFLLCGCSKTLDPAEVIVIDPIRHYYPIVQGEAMEINYELENVSDNPLFIQEVQTTCGCLVSRDDLPIVILPHKRGFVRLKFNTLKNNGYVEHFIDLYGNFKDTTMIELQFDTNVVPKADYVRDYEQLWSEMEKNPKTMREIVDGASTDKGYYTEDGSTPEDDTNRDMRNKIDRLTQ